LLLAIETATRATGVALLRGGELLAEERRDDGPAAEVLLPAVDAVLARAGAVLADIETFAVSIGPGSFTGLRIGLATVKGFCFGGASRVVPVPTLAALARGAPAGTGTAVAVLDARRGERYAAAFRPGELEARDWLPEGVYRPEEIAARIEEPVVLVGEGLAPCAAALSPRLGAEVAAFETLPAAGHVALLARGSAAVSAAALVPRYLRRAEAEVRRTGVRFERF
jgi:tRNA threonylcarbamoyladenosine biosynthesis protein TsaB